MVAGGTMRAASMGADQVGAQMGLHLGTARSLMGSLRTSGSRVANMAGDEFTSAFGGIADVTGIVAGSARSRMTQLGHRVCIAVVERIIAVQRRPSPRPCAFSRAAPD